MDFAEWVSVVVGCIGMATGVLGGVTAVIALHHSHTANKLAEKANGLAEESNGIADKAFTVSQTANRLASQANEISGDANAISQKALSVTSDQTVYDWRIEFDYESSTVFLVNDCANSAQDVLAVVRRADDTVAEGHIDELPGFKELPLCGDLLREQIAADAEHIRRINAADNGVCFLGSAGAGVVVDVVWTTQLGARRSEKIKKTLGQSKHDPVA